MEAPLGDENDENKPEETFEIIPGGEESSDSKLAAELEKAKKDYLYLRADFDNYKKSVIKERSEMIKFGSERVFCELLGVLDTLDLALQTEVTAETLDKYKEGVSLTANQLLKTMERFGVTEVPCLGAPFDPNTHEALSSEETDATPAGHITRVFKKAYKLHDRVIRPAQVVVAKAPAKSE
jgi:molecular chaperone GrpE